MNLVLGLNRAVLAEGLVFAGACGISPKEALRVFRSGPAWSRVMDTKGRRMIERDFEPVARLSQHRKDVDLILAAAARNGAQTPFSQLHQELLTKVERAGFGGEDNSAILRAFELE
jgi:3-hydroxyisobutyrate dehydrogenase-like beta-hydroxyacid dehydrogenase